jgi:RNA polymerase sigma factor (sigma-70 family)
MSSEASNGNAATQIDRQWAEWMALAQQGDKTAYARLLRECIPFIRRVANRQGVQADRLEDVVQDVLLTVHRVRMTYDPGRSFAAWLRSVSQRRAIDHLRSRGRLGRREVFSPVAFEAHEAPRINVDAQIDRQADAKVLAIAIEGLPFSQREAVEHLALRELSLEEAAASTGRSKGSLKVSLHRAIKSLRARMRGED